MMNAVRISTKIELLHCVKVPDFKSQKMYYTNVITDPENALINVQTKENPLINAQNKENPVQNLNGGKPITMIRLEKDHPPLQKDLHYPKDDKYRRNAAAAKENWALALGARKIMKNRLYVK